MPPAAAIGGRTPCDVVHEVGDGERLVRIDEIEAVMWNAVPLLARRLGRPDVQAAVDLPRVGRDDLGGNAVVEQGHG